MSSETGSFNLPDHILEPFMKEPNRLEHLIVDPDSVVEKRKNTLYNPVEYIGAVSVEQGAPYNFRINEEKFAMYLRREFGFGRRDFEKLRVYVLGEHEPHRPLPLNKQEREFFYDKEVYDAKKSLGFIREDDDGTQHITIYAHNIWRDLNRERMAILRFAKTKRRSEGSWRMMEKNTEDLFWKRRKHPKLGERFTQYLAHVGVKQKSGDKHPSVPIERAEKFINRYLMNYRAKNAIKDHIAIHETSHSFQYKVSWDKLRRLRDNILQLFMETIAESDEVRLSRKPEWIGIVEFEVPNLHVLDNELPKAA